MRFTIDLVTGKIVWNGPLPNMYADRDPALPDRGDLRVGADMQGDFHVAPAPQAGRAGLSEQLGAHGRRAMQASQLALLKSLQQLRPSAH